jgi:hypothetical protein
MDQTTQEPHKKRSEHADEPMIEGAAAIAEFIYRSRDPRYRRKIYYLAENSKIPIARLGSRLCLRPSTYKSWIAGQEARSVMNAKSNGQASERKDGHISDEMRLFP